MALLNSKIMICKNIKLDEKYVNVLNYNEEQMLNLCNNNRVAYSDSYSFIKDDESILVNFSYSDCLQSNYIAFQNPNYSNKWFFGFIDEVIYKGDSCTEIKFKIDSWATWYGNWNVSDCFVVREHVNDDVAGKHTVPEDFETGEYITQATNKIEVFNEFIPCMAVSELPPGDLATGPAVSLTFQMYNGIFSGFAYIVSDTIEHFSNLIVNYNDGGKGSAIKNIFMIPKVFANNLTYSTFSKSGELSVFAIIPGGNSASAIDYQGFDKPTVLGSYTPRNKKLLTYPYCYMCFDNGCGNAIEVRYEDYDTNKCGYTVEYALCAGGSVKFSPINYRGVSINRLYSVIGGKFPNCAWSSDEYVNWLTQNSINHKATAVSGIMKLFSPKSFLSGISDIISLAGAYEQHDTVPPTVDGNLNGGDINFVLGLYNPIIYQNCIKPEYAKIIDEMFDRRGYKVNLTKKPNITGRKYWNYIQVGPKESIAFGNVPKKFIEEINTIAQNGTTIWHDHNNIGNFSLNNTII